MFLSSNTTRASPKANERSTLMLQVTLVLISEAAASVAVDNEGGPLIWDWGLSLTMEALSLCILTSFAVKSDSCRGGVHGGLGLLVTC